ncbi:MAG: F0F1 ATP synthase subunit epsilon [Candidatus Omnitrophota bacterium]
MSKLFHLEILVPDRTLFAGDAVSLVAPGESGYLGILVDHAPLITTLLSGKITFRNPAGSEAVLNAKGGGFMEVYKNNVTILLDGVQEPA